MLAEPGATLARAALFAASIVAVVWSLAVVAVDGARGPRFLSDLPKPPARSRLTEIVFRTPGQIRPNTDWPQQMRARLADGINIGTLQPVPQTALWQLTPTIPPEWAR